MKFTKFLAVSSLSVLGLVISAPCSQYFAIDPNPIFSNREHIKNLDTEDMGVVVFRWQNSKGSETHTKCAWVILDESKLQSNLNLTAPQLGYLRSNQFKVIDVSSLRGNVSAEAYSYLTSASNHFNGSAHYSLMMKNWSGKTEIPEVGELSSVDVQPESQDLYSSMVSKLPADAPKPKKLSVDGVVFYLYKGWFGIWMGYRIHDYNAFRNWCSGLDLNNDQIKILVACQNTWMTVTSSFFSELSLPKEFLDAFKAVKEKDTVAGSPKTYVHVTGTWFGAVIDNSNETRSDIIGQLNASKISPKSVAALQHPWNLDWRKPITWRIETLRNNKDIQ